MRIRGCYFEDKRGPRGKTFWKHCLKVMVLDTGKQVVGFYEICNELLWPLKSKKFVIQLNN